MNEQNVVVNMLNELEITDYFYENDIFYNIYVRNDNKTKDLLWILEVDENQLDKTANSIDICPIAWNYAKRFDGKNFHLD